MGYIRWKATPIVEKLDRIDKMLNEVEPTFRDMVAQVKLAQQQPNIPDYMRQRLSGLDDEYRVPLFTLSKQAPIF